MFGSWNGSFGLDTDAGTVFKEAIANASANGALPPSPSSFQVFNFVPEDEEETTLFSSNSSNDQNGSVLSTANSQNTPPTVAPVATQKAPVAKGGFSWTIPVITFAALFIIFGGIGANEYMDRLRAYMISRKMNNKARGKAWPKFTLF